MPQTHEITAYAQRLILEYNRARKLLRKYFKKRHNPDEARAKIKEIIDNMTARQSKIIGYTLNDAFRRGAKESDKEISNATISAAATEASMGFDLTKVADTHLKNITQSNIGHIGKYNSVLTNQLQLEYNTLLADNKLVTSLSKNGWTPWLDKTLEKRGVHPEVIALAKGQTTAKKIIDILEMEGIHGGKHPREVSKMLLPHIQRHFGPEGVVIDNVGKFKKVLKVDADGNFKYVKQVVTRPYRATPKAYSNLLARTSMIQAHHKGRYQSLQKTGLVDHYISVSVLGANTCNLCATMHGQRVSHSEGPLYHPSGACDLKPIYKKNSGLKNKDPSYYENQRDQHFWKQHQLAEYNKNMPKGAKLKYHSMLPKDALTDMPGKEAMRTIRYNALGKPAGITPKTIVKKVVKPTEVKEKIKKKVEEKIKEKIKEKAKVKVEKELKKKVKVPKKGKKAQLEKIKKEERETANELWKKTDKDGCEHAKVTNSKTDYAKGNSDSVYIRSPRTSFKMAHTHPDYKFHPEWDSPLSGADIAKLLRDTKCTRLSAASSKRIFVVSRTKDTKYAPESFKMLSDKFTKKSNEIYKKSIATYKKKTRMIPNKSEAAKIWRDSILEMNKEVAKDYNLDYSVFSRT
jgi:hypothetical protein